MKRFLLPRLLVIVLTLTAGLSAPGCGGSESEVKIDDTPAAEKPTPENDPMQMQATQQPQ